MSVLRYSIPEAYSARELSSQPNDGYRLGVALQCLALVTRASAELASARRLSPGLGLELEVTALR